MIHFIIQLVLVLLLPPLLLGIINKVKAWFGGRVGPPWLQVYYDLWKLAQKDTVFSRTTTWIFRFGPMVVLVTTLAATLMLPLHPDRPSWFTGDFLLFAYLLALGRFFMVLAAADTGSAFEGMGAAREFTYACLGEPILLFGLLVLAKATQQFDLAGMFAGKLTIAAAGSHGLIYAALLLVMVSWFILLLVENCRVPFDDPNTHLELTMIHEVMILDHSGPALGVIVYSAGLKMFLFAGLVVRLLAPLRTGNEWADWALIIAGILLTTVAVGVVESVMARLRLIAIPRMLAAAGVLAGFALVILVSAS
jgi:formate hydrogenlyase subunit 4